jgi:hypothetical protein
MTKNNRMTLNHGDTENRVKYLCIISHINIQYAVFGSLSYIRGITFHKRKSQLYVNCVFFSNSTVDIHLNQFASQKNVICIIYNF